METVWLTSGPGGWLGSPAGVRPLSDPDRPPPPPLLSGTGAETSSQGPARGTPTPSWEPSDLSGRQAHVCLGWRRPGGSTPSLGVPEASPRRTAVRGPPSTRSRSPAGQARSWGRFGFVGHREAEHRDCRRLCTWSGEAACGGWEGNRPLHLGMEGRLVSPAVGGAGRGGGAGTQEEASRPLAACAQPAPLLTEDRHPNLQVSLPASPTPGSSQAPPHCAPAPDRPPCCCPAPTAPCPCPRPGPGSAAGSGTRSGPARPRGLQPLHHTPPLRLPGTWARAGRGAVHR